MELLFKNIPASYINLESDTAKRTKIEAGIKELGFTEITRVPGVLKGHKRAGVATAHLNALAQIAVPAAVFEDDCEVLIKESSIVVPDDADAVFLGYLGITADNPKNQRVTQGVHYWSVEGYPHLVRVQGLLSAHALIYLSERYRLAVRQVISDNLLSRTQQDVFVGQIQKDFNIYALSTPLVSQSGMYKETSNKSIFDY